VGEGLGEQRERPQGARDPNPLASGAEVEANTPAQPGGTGAEAGVPAPTSIELPYQVKKASSSGLEMRRQLGDLIPQSIQFRSTIRSCDDSWRVDLHGQPPSAGATVYPEFRATRERSQRAISGRTRIFGLVPLDWAMVGPCGALGRDPRSGADANSVRAAEAVKRKVADGRTPGSMLVMAAGSWRGYLDADCCQAASSRGRPLLGEQSRLLEHRRSGSFLLIGWVAVLAQGALDQHAELRPDVSRAGSSRW
jgi:hypothetical protein